MLAVYIPIIRYSIHEFARLWNVHSIRRQRNRPHSISGKPVKLYFWPSNNIQDHGIEPNTKLLEDIKTKITEYSKYLLLILAYYLIQYTNRYSL